jgi:hypothetical protein
MVIYRLVLANRYKALAKLRRSGSILSQSCDAKLALCCQPSHLLLGNLEYYLLAAGGAWLPVSSTYLILIGVCIAFTPLLGLLWAQQRAFIPIGGLHRLLMLRNPEQFSRLLGLISNIVRDRECLFFPLAHNCLWPHPEL